MTPAEEREALQQADIALTWASVAFEGRIDEAQEHIRARIRELDRRETGRKPWN